MRSIIIVLFLSYAGFCYSQTVKNIYIEKSDVGYDVYSATKELLLKFTKTNSDSTELALVKYIYDHQNEIEYELINGKVIVNNESKKHWLDYILTGFQIIGVIFTGIALLLTAKHYRHINILQK